MSGPSKVVLKLLVVGEVDVGKTSLLLSYADPNSDPHSPPPTNGVDVLSVQTTIENRPVTVQLWDTVCISFCCCHQHHTVVCFFDA